MRPTLILNETEMDFFEKNLTPFLGSENGTDFGPDPRTRTVHPQSVANIPVLQVLHLYVSMWVCMRASARLRAGARTAA